MAEFVDYGKTPRLFRDIVITEKINGTNAAIHIERGEPSDSQDGYVAGVQTPTGDFYKVAAQSRKRLITPDNDNFNFARWVVDNAETLVADLGEGVHFGEWYGQGIQKAFPNMKVKRFALFNVKRWEGVWFNTPELECVPVLYKGDFNEALIRSFISSLRTMGSTIDHTAKAEGIVIYHTAANSVFKVLCENDELPKSAYVPGHEADA